MKQIAPTASFASHLVLSSLSTLLRVINMNVCIIGGTLEALLLAIHYQKKGIVSIFEIDAELGLPIAHPGRVLDPTLLDEYLTQDQIEFLKLSPNPDGWGCRWEWVMKHMTTVAASMGVNIYPRTRVLSMRQHGETTRVSTTKNERHQPIEFDADLIISTRETSRKPGRLQHVVDESLVISFTNQEYVQWFGGTLLTLHHPLSSMPTPALTLSRSDGQTEVWWQGECPWTPPTGYLETCLGSLPSSVDALSFDAILHRVNDFVNSVDD